MSAITNLIFNNQKHNITSSFGNRNSISTSAGATPNLHQGTDYGTFGQKLPQYAIEDGYVFDAARSSSDGANYVWVIYPRIKLAMLHYHLDSFKVKAGQTVKKGTLLGYTGKTGKATGIHLHLGIRNLSSASDYAVRNMTWDELRKYDYVNPQSIKYVPEQNNDEAEAKSSFLPSKGYFAKGDVSVNVGKIASFMRSNFPAYTDSRALGNTYGNYLIAAISEFQRRTGLVPDGKTGPKTLSMLKRYGFSE